MQDNNLVNQMGKFQSNKFNLHFVSVSKCQRVKKEKKIYTFQNSKVTMNKKTKTKQK